MKPSLKNIFLDGARWADKIGTRYRYAITIGLIAFLIGVWLIAYYLPLEKEQITLNNENISLQIEQLKAIQAKNECAQLSEACTLLEEKINNYAVLQQQNVKATAAYIFDESKKHNITLLSFVQDKAIKKSWYEKNGMDCVLQGSLKNIMDFLTAIKSSEKMISCSKIKLEHLVKDEFKVSCTLFSIFFEQHKAQA
jgi:hypothetical protein